MKLLNRVVIIAIIIMLIVPTYFLFFHRGSKSLDTQHGNYLGYSERITHSKYHQYFDDNGNLYLTMLPPDSNIATITKYHLDQTIYSFNTTRYMIFDTNSEGKTVYSSQYGEPYQKQIISYVCNSTGFELHNISIPNVFYRTRQSAISLIYPESVLFDDDEFIHIFVKNMAYSRMKSNGDMLFYPFEFENSSAWGDIMYLDNHNQLYIFYSDYIDYYFIRLFSDVYSYDDIHIGYVHPKNLQTNNNTFHFYINEVLNDRNYYFRTMLDPEGHRCYGNISISKDNGPFRYVGNWSRDTLKLFYENSPNDSIYTWEISDLITGPGQYEVRFDSGPYNNDSNKYGLSIYYSSIYTDPIDIRRRVTRNDQFERINEYIACTLLYKDKIYIITECKHWREDGNRLYRYISNLTIVDLNGSILLEQTLWDRRTSGDNWGFYPETDIIANGDILMPLWHDNNNITYMLIDLQGNIIKELTFLNTNKYFEVPNNHIDYIHKIAIDNHSRFHLLYNFNPNKKYHDFRDYKNYYYWYSWSQVDIKDLISDPNGVPDNN